MKQVQTCYLCGQVKPLTDFHKNKAMGNGHLGKCKNCVKEYNAKYREEHHEQHKSGWAKYRADNHEKIKEYNTKYRIDNHGKVKDYNIKYYIENCEKLKAIQVKYCTENPEKVKESTAKWRAENPEKLKESNAKHKSKRRCMGYIPLNKSFDGAEGHHIGRDYVIFIPKELHRSMYHNFFKRTNMKEINALAFDYLCTSATI